MGFQNPYPYPKILKSTKYEISKVACDFKIINSKSFGLTNIEIELEIQIHSIPIHSRKTNAPLYFSIRFYFICILKKILHCYFLSVHNNDYKKMVHIKIEVCKHCHKFNVNKTS